MFPPEVTPTGITRLIRLFIPWYYWRHNHIENICIAYIPLLTIFSGLIIGSLPPFTNFRLLAKIVGFDFNNRIHLKIRLTNAIFSHKSVVDSLPIL